MDRRKKLRRINYRYCFLSFSDMDKNVEKNMTVKRYVLIFAAEDRKPPLI